MKNILLFFVLFFISNVVFGSHAAGGYMEYHHISGNTYEIKFFFLRDCSGIQLENVELYASNDCGQACVSLGDMTEQSTSNVDFGCGNTCSPFNFSGYPGYKLIELSKIVTLSYPCNSWKFSVNISARNTVDYINGSGNYYVYCKINNSQINSSSPTLLGANVVVGCVGNQSTPQHSFSVPSGNNVSYELVSPQNSSGISSCSGGDVNFAGNLNFNMPFPSAAPFNMNQNTGVFSFTPTQIGTSYFGEVVKSYKNGNYLGEIVVDGTIIVASCPPPGNVDFGKFDSTDEYFTYFESPATQQCESALLEGDGADIQSVVINSPPNIQTSYTLLNNGDAVVNFCMSEANLNCEPIYYEITVNAKTNGGSDCLGQANSVGDSKVYNVIKKASTFCPVNLFYTNRGGANSYFGVFPPESRAEERIWIGNEMPPIAPPDVLVNLGPVEINQDYHAIAGTEIIIPSCQGGVTGCVTINASTTLEISPGYCNSECEPTPLDLEVEHYFQCGNEKLIANVQGSGPYTFVWDINGQEITTTTNEVNINDIVSAIDGALVPYTCTVVDAFSGTGSTSGEIWGTKRFYEPISNNTIYFDYPPEALWEPGEYYAGQPGVDFSTPFHIIDLVNSSPPWYGATKIEMNITDRYGVYDFYNKTVDLEGGDDWSMDNGEFWWNGHWNNDPNQPCTGGAADIMNYTVEARNCYTEVHTEQSALVILACTTEPWVVTPVKSSSKNNNHQPNRTIQVPNGLDESNTSEEAVKLIPNPTESDVRIVGDFETINNVKLFDQTGKEMGDNISLIDNSLLDLSGYSNGVYTLSVEIDGIFKTFKIVKL